MTPQDELQAAIDVVNPRYIIALFSGGTDSTVSTHIAMQHSRFSFALKIDTGIGVPETNQYVRDTCKAWGIALKEHRAVDYVQADGTPDPQVYRDLCLTNGFPGPAMHNRMYQRLKEKALRTCIRELERESSEPILLVSGCRSDESTRRMANTKPLQNWEGQKYFASPIWKLTKPDVLDYMEEMNIPRNPVTEKIHKSGECLCGAFAKPGELAELEFWYPDVARDIHQLETEVRAAGFPWGWEDEPPDWFIQYKKGQMFFDEAGLIPEGVLCSSCISQR